MKKLLLALITLITIQSQAQCWKQLQTEGSFTLGIKPDGTLWSWGYNYYGQLGDGTTINKSTPAQVGTATNWYYITTGMGSVMALKTDGTIWAWGNNSYGQLAPGNSSVTTPIQVGSGNDWKSIAISGYHMLAIKNDGTLWAWGYNWHGGLGLGTTQNAALPTQVGTDNNWSAISLGAMSSSSYALKTDGTLWSWGTNDSGQLGNGAMISSNNPGGPDVLVPTQVGSGTNWKAVSAGTQYVIAQKNDNTLWTWGNNAVWQLGDATITGKSLPQQIGTDTWISFDASNSFSVGVKSNGTLHQWGSYNYPSTIFFTPTQVTTDTNWVSVKGGGLGCSMAEKANKQIMVWGKNSTGELGLGNTNPYTAMTFFGEMCAEVIPGNQNGLNFDGINDHVSTNYTGISGTGARTVEAWIKVPTTNPAAQKVIVDWGAVTPNGSRFTLCLLNNILRLEVGGNGLNGTTLLNDGNWHHVAATYNAAEANNVVLYVDGVQQAAGGLTLSTASGTVKIGTGADYVNYFNGTIDEVRIWDVARTQAEISDNKDLEFCIVPLNLKAYYKFNQGIAAGSNPFVQIATDSAGAGSGTLYGFALNGAVSNWVTGTAPTALTALATLDNITLTANVVAGATYQWLDCGNANAIIPNATAQTYTPTLTGSYAVKITNSNGCTATSACIGVLICNVNDGIDLNGITLTAAQSGGAYQWINCVDDTPVANANVQSFTPAVTGDYKVVITMPDTCTATTECMHITVPVCALNDDVMLEGTTLTANQENASYQWINCADNEPVNDANGQTFTPTVTGSYAVIISTPDNCTVTSACTEVLICNVNAGVNNNSGILMAVIQAGAAYQWINCDNNNTPITGATGSAFTPTVSGNYALMVTIGDCSDTSDCQYVLVCNLNDAVTLTGTTLTAGQANASYQWMNCADDTAITGANAQSFTPAASGSYSVIISTPDNCTATSGCYSVCMIDNTVANNGGTLVAMQAGAIYQWINCADDTAINGATSATFTPITSGNYAVQIWLSNECTATSECEEVLSDRAFDLAKTITAYPNPTTDMVIISMGDVYDAVTLTVYNIAGQVISTQQFSDTQTLNADLSEAASGMYFLDVKTGAGQSAVLKVIRN
jgi:hypothetical protein